MNITVTVGTHRIADDRAERQFRRVRLFQVLAREKGTLTFAKIVSIAMRHPDLVSVLREALFWRRAIGRHFSSLADRGVERSVVTDIWLLRRFRTLNWGMTINVPVQQ